MSLLLALQGGGGGIILPPVLEIPAGRKQLRSIYRLTVDGKVFHFRSMAGALAFLDKANAFALLAVQAQTRRATNLKAVSSRQKSDA